MKTQVIDGLLSKGLLSADISTMDQPADINDNEVIVIGTPSGSSAQDVCTVSENSPTGPVHFPYPVLSKEDAEEVICAMKERISFLRGQNTKRIINRLMKNQVEKYKRGEKIKCSESLLNKIKRMAIEDDMFSAPEHSVDGIMTFEEFFGRNADQDTRNRFRADAKKSLKKMRSLVKEHSA